MAKYQENNNRPSITGNVVGFTPATFQPFVYTPQQMDMSILQNSLNALSERKAKFDQQRAQIAQALGNVNLHNSEDKWLNDYIDNINSEINTASQFGDYGSAMEIATNMAMRVATDPALKGRIKANENFEKEKLVQQQRRDSGKITDTTYEWWLKNNPYNYTDTYDENGNIIGGTGYETKFRPVDDIDWSKLALDAFKLISPHKTTKRTSSSSSVDNQTDEALTRNGRSYKPGEAISSSHSSEHGREWITESQIKEVMNELLSRNSDAARQLEQAYAVDKFDYDRIDADYKAALLKDPNSAETNDLYQQLKRRNKLMQKNGAVVDYEEYVRRKLNEQKYSKNLAYNHKVDVSESSSSYTLRNVATGNGPTNRTGGITGGYIDGYQGGYTVSGPDVKIPFRPGVVRDDVTGAANRINNAFK